MIDIGHADPNRWSLRFDHSAPPDRPNVPGREFCSWEAKITGFSEPSQEVGDVLAEITEVHLELPRSWWQWIIPISHVYIVHNVEWDHTPKAGEPVTFKVASDVDGGMAGVEMCWRWHIPGCIRKCRRWMFFTAGKRK